MKLSDGTEQTLETQQTQLQQTETSEGTSEKVEVKQGMSAEDFNRAFSAREKAMLSKIEKLMGQKTASNEIEETETKSSKAKTEPQDAIVKLQRKIQEMEKRERDAQNEARSLKLKSGIQNLIKDKVHPDWMDVALDKISSQVTFEDSKPSFVFDDLSYSLEEGVNKWLSQEANKRFLPSKAVAKQTHGAKSLALQGKPDPKAEARARWELAQEAFLKG